MIGSKHSPAQKQLGGKIQTPAPTVSHKNDAVGGLDTHPHHESETPKHGPWKFAYWIVGIGSTIWLLLRSGTRPRRLSYPCQRVAAVNSVGFLTYLAAILGSATLLGRLKAAFTPGRLLLFAVGLLLTVTLQSSITAPAFPVLAESPDLPAWTSGTAVSNVFAITNVPEPQHSLDGGSIPSGVGVGEALHDEGVDALVELMEIHGDYFYKTSAHPDGLFGSDDVVVLKVNNQWDWRNGTNTDVVKGVIYRLVQHPDGFTGAVIIAENTQNHNDDWYHQSSVGNDEHNSQFQDQSYLEVAQAFADQSYHVCIADWKSIRANLVPDYDAGNDNDGYVLDAVDNKLSYPKFGVNCNGASYQISMRYGLWDGVSSFDNTRLKMINMPVLKRHGAAWGTIAVKNYLGFITTYGSRWSGVSEMHCWLLGPSDNGYSCTSESTAYGLIGRQMAHIRRADLDVVDAIWVNADSNLGGGSVRQDVLLASRDPFAVDYYASDYILGPLIHTQHPTDAYQQAMASTTDGWFRNIQLRNVACLRNEGVTDTINMNDSMTAQEELDQFNVYVADAGQVTPPHTFEDSFKSASRFKLEGGEVITYTIVLYEGTEAALTLTDTIPLPCTYVPGSATIEPSWKGPVQDTGGIYWSGAVTSTVPVTITFQVQVPVTDTTWFITNRALASRDGAAPVELTAASLLNGFYVYLPLVLRNY